MLRKKQRKRKAMLPKYINYCASVGNLLSMLSETIGGVVSRWLQLQGKFNFIKRMNGF